MALNKAECSSHFRELWIESNVRHARQSSGQRTDISEFATVAIGESRVRAAAGCIFA